MNPHRTKGKEQAERITARAAEMANDLGQPVLGQAVITGTDLAQAGKDLAEQQLVGTWLSSFSRAAHSPAVAGCFGEGGSVWCMVTSPT